MASMNVSLNDILKDVHFKRPVVMTGRTVRVCVSSSNPVKVGAAKAAFSRMFPDSTFEVTSVDVPSGVPAQPYNDDTLIGSANRVLAAWKARIDVPDSDIDFVVGMEGGVFWTKDRMLTTVAEFIIVGCDGRIGHSTTPSYALPPSLSTLVEQGMELGHANDAVFNLSNSKHKGGSIAALTGGIIGRMEYYTMPLSLALLPWSACGDMFYPGDAPLADSTQAQAADSADSAL